MVHYVDFINGMHFGVIQEGFDQPIKAIKVQCTITCDMLILVATPFLEECEDDTHTPKMGTWESFGTLETSKFDCRGQNTSPRDVLHIIGKLLKYRCRKLPHMNHLDICTSYGKKKGQESN
jgi:hypothetical protein